MMFLLDSCKGSILLDQRKKKALAIASAFFSEIRLRRVKYGFAV
jgi:hypothetical protein